MTVDIPATISAATGLVTAIGVIVMFVVGRKKAQIVEGELKEIKHISNSVTTALMQTIAITRRQLANSTKYPVDEAAAIEAERLYADRLQSEKEQRDATSRVTTKKP